MADTDSKKIDPKVAKGMLVGAAAAVLNGGTDNWRNRDTLRTAIRACDKAGVKREEIEKIVGAAVSADVAPQYEASEIKTEPSVYLSPVEKALAKIAAPAMSLETKAFTAGFASGLFGLMKNAHKLTGKERASIPSGEFALPGRRYPIENRQHAANAKARVAQHGTPSEKARVNAAVESKYPDMGK